MGEVEFSPAVGSGGGEGSQLDAVAGSRRCVGGGVVGRREAEVARLAAAAAASGDLRGGRIIAQVCSRGGGHARPCGRRSVGGGLPVPAWQRGISRLRVGEFGVRPPPLSLATAEAVPATTRFFFLAVFLLSLFLSVPPAIAGSC
uniref:Uncharacterized protein n=1 Tax=Oryza nivara TaxID=4536 RepID=A0A0E0G6Y6_ORYNI